MYVFGPFSLKSQQNYLTFNIQTDILGLPYVVLGIGLTSTGKWIISLNGVQY